MDIQAVLKDYIKKRIDNIGVVSKDIVAADIVAFINLTNQERRQFLKNYLADRINVLQKQRADLISQKDSVVAQIDDLTTTNQGL